MCGVLCILFFEGYGRQHDLHVLTHSLPTLRSSELTGRCVMSAQDRAWGPDNVIVWSPLQQRWIDHARARVAEVAQWEDRAMAMDHLAHMERHQFRSEEHTSELQSLMRLSSAVFCLKKTTHTPQQQVLNSKQP